MNLSRSVRKKRFFIEAWKELVEEGTFISRFSSSKSVARFNKVQKIISIKFEIWAKLKPDRSILQTCSRFLVKQNEEPPKDEYEEFTMRIPIKVTGANQVLPVKFSLLCVFTVNAVTFSPPLVDFGNVFNQLATSLVINLENHSLLP